jgi:hypothetical protein
MTGFAILGNGVLFKEPASESWETGLVKKQNYIHIVQNEKWN